jgi:hypothetical protein
LVAVYDESQNMLYNISAPAGTYSIFRGFAYDTYGALTFVYSGNQSIATADIKVW